MRVVAGLDVHEIAGDVCNQIDGYVFTSPVKPGESNYSAFRAAK
jgi:hypothetical protein